MTGTDYSETGAQDYINVNRVRIPKLQAGKKSVIDYTTLNATNHSKV